jgi:hypothetical protein
MTITNRASAIRAPTSRGTSTIPGLGANEQERMSSSEDVVHHRPAVMSVGLPAPEPQSVQQARAYLTSRHATGVDEVLWETRKRPMPDRDAIDAVITAGDQPQDGGEHAEPGDIAAALVVLSAVRLNLDQTEARLLKTAQASGMGLEQIAALLHLSVGEVQERHRQLKPRLDEPAAAPCQFPVSRVAARNAAPHRPRRSARDQPTWDELDDDWDADRR